MRLFWLTLIVTTGLVAGVFTWLLVSLMTGIGYWVVPFCALFGAIGLCGAVWLSRSRFERKEKDEEV